MTNAVPISVQLNVTPRAGHDDVVRSLPEPVPPPQPDQSARRKSKRLKVSDLMATEFPPQKFVVENLLPVGLSMLAGAPKLGKSWASLDLALSVATGRPFMSRATDQGAVLYLALEDSPRRLQERLQRIGPGVDWEDLPLELWTEIEPVDAGGLTALREWLEGAERPRLIIADIWGRFESRTPSTKNDYDRITQTMQPIQALAVEFDVAILLIHHTKKSTGEGAQGGDPFDQVLGSRALTSNMDLTMVLTRTRMQQDAVLDVTGRDVEESKINVTFDKTSCRWDVTAHESGPALSPEKQLVLDAVQQGFTKATAVAEHLGKKRPAVANHLTDLVREGHLVRLGGGEYGFPTSDAHETAEPADMTDNGDDEPELDVYDLI